jgi:hypothetical protein
MVAHSGGARLHFGDFEASIALGAFPQAYNLLELMFFGGYRSLHHLPPGVRSSWWNQTAFTSTHQVVHSGELILLPPLPHSSCQAAVQTDGEEGVFGCFECGARGVGVSHGM